jgi:phosphatidylcholine synthase
VNALAWLVHLYTASSAVLAFLATRAAVEYRFRDAFFWLALTIAIDATDGFFARAARVSTRIPWFNGAKLDDLVDYLTYVFVPAVIVWRAQLVPDGWMIGVAGAMLISSGYGFSRVDAKTEDHFFTGFPSYWNIVVFYLYVLHLSQTANAIWLLVFAVLVFVPIRYAYPSRMPHLRGLTNALGVGWGAALLVMIWQLPAISPVLLWGSLLYVIYYFGLSLAMQTSSPLAPGH